MFPPVALVLPRPAFDLTPDHEDAGMFTAPRSIDSQISVVRVNRAP